MMFIKKDETWNALNVFERRYYLITLSNIFVNEFIQIVFKDMKSTNSIYDKIKVRLQRFYKQWKSIILINVAKWIKRYIFIQRSSKIQKLNVMIMKQLKTVVFRNFDDSWFLSVFEFDVETINFENINELDVRFLRCESEKILCSVYN